MAIYHLSVKVISRSTGASALAAGAYRCGGRFYDERLNRHHDFTKKENVIHSEVMLPEGALRPGGIAKRFGIGLSLAKNVKTRS